MSNQKSKEGCDRRNLLKSAAVAGLGSVLASAETAHGQDKTDQSLLPTVKLGPHNITRLIIGGNPVYGYSHFNKMLSRYFTDWHTPDRVMALLRRCQEVGINTWQNSWAERTISDLERFRQEGGTLQWLCLGNPDWDRFPERIDEAAKHKPIGIAPHGHLGERLHREKKLTTLTDLLKRIRDRGVLVGLSAHNPELLELAEEKGWDVDYYMCCLYYLTRPRPEFQKLVGANLPLGEIYLPTDPPRMLQHVQSTRKPCLVYKVLAAGRRTDSPAEVRRCFETALTGIKPTDALIVGMMQQQSDQVGTNAALVRDICASKRPN
jgi:hypothetical protein